MVGADGLTLSVCLTVKIFQHQVNKRDMSISILRTFISQRKLKHKAMLARQAKALSAYGLRALRYAHEIEGIGQVVALDNDKGDSNSKL
uniref:tRNA (guanine(26)-N(2))-dimethyltransferase n=1 Tax=Solanum lycopersicum TaxID=4081 RepID=A0A3Q7FLK4_SOLLC